jgi:hypothetical protein
MIANIEQILAELRRNLDEAADRSKTSLFDSHPSDEDRIAAARRRVSTPALGRHGRFTGGAGSS